METNNAKTFFKDNWKNILLMVFFFIIIALIMSTTCANRKLDVAENNLKAMTDTLHTYKLKNGELLYAKQGYIAKIEELEKTIGITKAEIKELEKKLGSSLATISKLQGMVKIDTIHTTDSVYITIDPITHDSVYHDIFFYNDRWLSLNGETDVKIDPFETSTVINSIKMDVPLKVGTTTNNQWFATSENPYVSFTSIEGANIEKAKTKKHSIGVNVGIGAGAGYGVCIPPSGGQVNSGIILGPVIYVGVGYTYRLFEF